MYKCEICEKRRGLGMDHSKCSKKLQEMHKDAPKPVRTVRTVPIKAYNVLYERF